MEYGGSKKSKYALCKPAAAIFTQSLISVMKIKKVINLKLLQKTADPYSCCRFNIPACGHYVVQPFLVHNICSHLTLSQAAKYAGDWNLTSIVAAIRQP